MKKTIYTAMITLGLWSCYSQPSKTEAKPAAEPLPTATADANQSTVVIKDYTQYDKAFINELAQYKEPLQLNDNHIVAGADTIYFPEDLPLNKTIDFKATKDQKNYLLSIKRTSLTNLTYAFKLMDEKDKLLDAKSGTAILGSLFFLGSETDNDTKTGEVYGSYEYWDKNSDCWFALRIGHEKDAQGKQRAMVKDGCEDKNKQTLKLDKCPTLRAE